MSIDYCTTLVPVDAPEDADKYRQLVKAASLSCVGLAGDKHKNAMRRVMFESLLGPPPAGASWQLDVPFRCWQDENGKWKTQGVSTCGLVANGIWRKMGVTADFLYQPYVSGTAVSAAHQFGIHSGAWNRCTSLEHRPAVGDYVLMGAGIGTHVGTCVGWKEDNEGKLWMQTVEGGQVDPVTGLQCVQFKERQWMKRANLVFAGNKSVGGWVSVVLLPRYNIYVMAPQGWETV